MILSLMFQNIFQCPCSFCRQQSWCQCSAGERRFAHDLFKLQVKQECIPVGCVYPIVCPEGVLSVPWSVPGVGCGPSWGGGVVCPGGVSLGWSLG